PSPSTPRATACAAPWRAWAWTSPRATRSTTRSRSRPTSPRWCATRSRRERWRAGDPQQVVEQRGRGDPGAGPGTLQDERLLAVAVAPDRDAVVGATAVRQRIAGRQRLQSRAGFEAAVVAAGEAGDVGEPAPALARDAQAGVHGGRLERMHVHRVLFQRVPGSAGQDQQLAAHVRAG